VDVLEFAFLSEPLRRILHHLCEGARQKVLGTSVEKAEVSGVMESLVHGAWLADIEVARGASALNGAIRPARYAIPTVGARQPLPCAGVLESLEEGRSVGAP
jgi:hypothetical protein